MNRNSRSIRLIETCFVELESNQRAAPADALLVLDEIRRLERKWNEQVAAGSTRRIASDFKTLDGWLRRWKVAVRRLPSSDRTLEAAVAKVDAKLRC